MALEFLHFGPASPSPRVIHAGGNSTARNSTSAGEISFWDAMIVHAARLAGAEALYSEDSQSGSVIGGIPVVNPFAKTHAD
jgi:predicted nucleic acid-binding protein